MKVIDLLNKIANGEEVPKRFIYDDKEFYLQSKDCWRCDDAIFEECFILEDLKKEIEIIEEHKIPEKWQHWYNPKAIEDFKLARFNSNDMKEICKTIGFLMEHTNTIKTKLDEIIDYLKENKNGL